MIGVKLSPVFFAFGSSIRFYLYRVGLEIPINWQISLMPCSRWLYSLTTSRREPACVPDAFHGWVIGKHPWVPPPPPGPSHGATTRLTSCALGRVSCSPAQGVREQRGDAKTLGNASLRSDICEPGILPRCSSSSWLGVIDKAC